MIKTALMPAFEPFDLRGADGTMIHGVSAGEGPPVLLLHGHPQTHLAWRQVAPRIVEAGFTAVATDLRGYGDSDRPAGGADHRAYSKRAMASDQVEVMRRLGHERLDRKSVV